MLWLQPRGADHMHGAGLGRQCRKLHRRGGGGKVDHRLCPGESLQRIIGDHHAKGCPAHRFAHVMPDPGGAGPFHAARQPRLIGRQDGPDQHLAHAPGCPGYDDPRQV